MPKNDQILVPISKFSLINTFTIVLFRVFRFLLVKRYYACCLKAISQLNGQVLFRHFENYVKCYLQ